MELEILSNSASRGGYVGGAVPGGATGATDHSDGAAILTGRGTDDNVLQSGSTTGASRTAGVGLKAANSSGVSVVARVATGPTQGQGQTTTVTPSAVGIPTTRKQKRTAQIQFMTLCWALFLLGWSDASTGPLLPRIQNVYHVGFVVVSLIFVFACVGFISGAVSNVPLGDKLGFGKTLVIGSICPIIAQILQSLALPFPVFVMSFTINGFGMALLDAQSNGYVAMLKDSPQTKMGLLHAAYGAGALCAPLVATQFSQLSRWSFHYLVSLAISLINLALILAVFKLKSQDECLAEIGQAETDKSTSEDSTFSQMFRLKAVHYLAFFLLVYVGVEVTIGGWIVTFIINVRHGGPSSGYISSGFFAGLMLGRVLLIWVNEKVGNRRVMYIYALLAIGLEIVIWFTPSLIGNAIAVAIVGMLLGPMYPIAMIHSGKVLPQWLLTSSIGWVAGFGQAGSAVLPFMTGAIAQRWGIRSLQPLLVIMMVLMIALWKLVPSTMRRPD
ncbi:hypothetical protein AMATHDRAFT_64868 [Amanita thiersii Skay4041]|uniref:Major facilitator superfamily (MFS) profile domain-containing protein n=1 Tax=Amanita thiersii Skay4041 TaxID=703135 RepID=A0A2A9NLT1_9AGAR|nr:hypothetical protein AMATHDRAFT_64868 [Amanita thiersii Skay4041]